MKAEFELSVDKDGKPCIRFKNHENNNSLDQKVLKNFIQGAKSNGIEINHKSGCLSPSENESWSLYEINIKNKEL
jgi:hypothetical protein